jgi:3-(3-hydroxy-phenyl)propionate hydroxylase
LLGRRMPDLDLSTDQGLTSVFTLLHEARPVLLTFGATSPLPRPLGPGAVDLGSWADRIRSVDADYSGAWELPVLGPIPPAPAVAIRPDGHVAWTGDPADPDLPRVLTTWFGPPNTGQTR